MAEHAEVRALNPQTWFPLLKASRSDTAQPETKFALDIRPMFYIPKLVKQLDGMWMKRCVESWLKSLPSATLHGAVLDAHFGYPEGVGCYLAGKSLGLPVSITIRGLEVDLLRHASIGPQLINALQNAARVIAVSDSLRDEAMSAGVSGDKIVVIPNGVEADIFCPGERLQARRRLGIDDAERLVVCVATVKPVKGHDHLLRAFARLPSQSGLRLVCIGEACDGKWMSHLKRLIVEAQLEEAVSLIGAKPPAEVADWLRASDVFALASRREGCCNAVLESLATGIPVVATRVGNNAEFVTEGRTGFLSASGDIAAMARHLETALTRSWCAQSISQTMRPHTWSSVGKKALEVLSDCAAHVGRHARPTQPSMLGAVPGAARETW